MVTSAESKETMRIARKRIDALNIPSLDGMSVMRVDKINDTAAVTMTVVPWHQISIVICKRANHANILVTSRSRVLPCRCVIA